jgi:hypothetical protein
VSFSLWALVSYIGAMTDHPRSRAELLAVLWAHKAEFRARGDATELSNLDLAVRRVQGSRPGGSTILAGWKLCANDSPHSLAANVDLVEESVVGSSLRAVIAPQGVRAL